MTKKLKYPIEFANKLWTIVNLPYKIEYKYTYSFNFRCKFPLVPVQIDDDKIIKVCSFSKEIKKSFAISVKAIEIENSDGFITAAFNSGQSASYNSGQLVTTNKYFVIETDAVHTYNPILFRLQYIVYLYPRL